MKKCGVCGKKVKELSFWERQSIPPSFECDICDRVLTEEESKIFFQYEEEDYDE